MSPYLDASARRMKDATFREIHKIQKCVKQQISTNVYHMSDSHVLQPDRLSMTCLQWVALEN